MIRDLPMVRATLVSDDAATRFVTAPLWLQIVAVVVAALVVLWIGGAAFFLYARVVVARRRRTFRRG